MTYTYLVSYNAYDNMVGTKKVLSITIYQRVRDDSAKKNTTEKIGLKSYKTLINIGKEAGQEVFHLHLHILGEK